MSLNLLKTWLIVIANPILAYGIVKFIGLEDQAEEYYIEENVLYFYMLMIVIEICTIKLLKVLADPIPFVTPTLFLIIFASATMHVFPLMGYFAKPYLSDPIQLYNIDEFITYYYSAIIDTLFALQVFLFGISFIFDSGFHTDSERYL